MSPGVEIPRPQQGQAHGQLCAIGVELVIVQECVFGGEADRRRGVEAEAEPLDPAVPGTGDRRRDELLQSEGEHHVELATAVQKGLGPQDVASAGQGPVGEADWSSVDRFANAIGDIAFALAAESSGHAARRDEMPAVVSHGRAGQRSQDRRVDRALTAHEPKLPSCRGKRPEIAPTESTSPPEGGPSVVLVAEEQVRLRLGGRRVVARLPRRGQQVESIPRQRCGPGVVPGQEQQGGSVDGREVAMGPGPNAPVVTGRIPGQAGSLSP